MLRRWPARRNHARRMAAWRGARHAQQAETGNPARALAS